MKVGDRIYYVPFKGCRFKDIEFGIVKAINEMDPTHVFVVFNCGNEWDLYQNFTGQNTKITSLYPGWSGIHTDSDGNRTYFAEGKVVQEKDYMDTTFWDTL